MKEITKKEECKCGISRTFLSGKEKGKCLDCGRYVPVNKEEWEREFDYHFNWVDEKGNIFNEDNDLEEDGLKAIKSWISQKKKEWEQEQRERLIQIFNKNIIAIDPNTNDLIMDSNVLTKLYTPNNEEESE